MSKPLQYALRWEVNSICNLRCIHCCNSDSRRTTGLHTAELVSALRRLAQGGLRHVHFLGGEPLLRDDLFELCRESSACGVSVSFNTNGLLLSQPDVRSAVLDAPIESVTVSIDGVDSTSHDYIRGRGTFTRVTRALQSLVEERDRRGLAKPALAIQSVLTKVWYQRAGSLLDLAERLRCVGVIINNLALAGRAIRSGSFLALTPAEDFEAAGKILLAAHVHPALSVKTPYRAKVTEYYREATGVPLVPQKFSCPGASTSAYVYPDGEVAPCVVAQLNGMGAGLEPLSVINSDTDGFWRSPYFSRFRHVVHGPLSRTYKDLTPCRGCHYLGLLCRPCPLRARSSPSSSVTPCEIAIRRLRQ